MYQPISVPVGGGLDLITPDMAMKPGRAIRALNYEPVASGYQRFAGYERFDGRAAPSAATYWRLDFTGYGFTGAVLNLGQKLWNGPANSCYLVAIIITSGSYANGDAAGYLIVTNLLGNMVPSMNSSSGGGQNYGTVTAQTLAYNFALGPELVPNGNFSDATGHTLTGATISGGTLNLVSGFGTFDIITPLGVIVADLYTYEFDITATAADEVTLRVGGGPILSIPATLGHHAGVIYSKIGPTQNITVGIGVGTASIDNLTVKRGITSAFALTSSVEVARGLIQAVPGSGPVRGIWGFNGDIFAFRDDAGAANGVMWKATTAGWVAATNLTRVDFTFDSATMTGPLSKIYPSPPYVKQVVTNTSGGAAKGTVQAVTYTGTVGTITTGFMLLSGYVAATWTAAAQQIWIGAVRAGTTTAAATTTAPIPPGGRYFFLNHNFYGSEDRTAMYIVNGVGNALVYNGTGYAAIVTGMAIDKPTRLAEHQQSLFLAFPGGSLQSSQVGEPLSFNAILGASEIGVGSEITDLIPANQSTLLIFAKRSISALYGHDATDYQLEKIIETEGDEAVSLPYTAQRLGTPLYMDNVGIRKIEATPNYGNFNLGSISRLIEPLLRSYRAQGVNPVATLTWKRKDQYWVFFDNGAGLVVYLGMKDPQILPLNLGFTVTCANTVTVNGVERAFVGTSTGYVMELDKGTSFDGAAIEHYIRFPFISFKGPRQNKNFGEVTATLETTGTTTLSVSADLNNGDGSEPPVAAQLFSIVAGGSTLVDSNTSEAFYRGQIEAEAVADLGCEGKSISLKLSGLTSTEQPHTITALTFYVSPRGVEQ